MIKNPIVIKRYQTEIDKFNPFFGESERIRKFEIIHFEWTPDTGELTPTLKLKRTTINITKSSYHITSKTKLNIFYLHY